MSWRITSSAPWSHAVPLLAMAKEYRCPDVLCVESLLDFNKQPIDICLQPMLDCTIGLYRKVQMDVGNRTPPTKIRTMGEVSIIL